MPSQITSRFQQLRKDDNKVVWSAPDWSFCDIRLRRVTRAVNLCSGHWSKKVEGREWRTNRLFKVRQYERADYDEFSEGQALSTRKETPRPASKIRYWRTRDEAQHYYSTYAPVELLDHLDDSGKCIDCGGKRAPHKCECTIVDRPRRQPEPMTIGEMKSYALSLVPELRFGGIDLSYLVDAPHPPLTAVMSDQRCTSDA